MGTKARVIAIAAILVAGCGVAAVAATRDDPLASNDLPDVQYAPSDSGATSVSNDPRVIVSRSIANSGSAAVASLGTKGSSAHDWLSVTLQDAGSAEANLRAEWKAEVAAGAIRDDLHDSGLAPVAGLTVTREHRDATRSTAYDGTVGQIAFDQRFDDPEPAALSASLREIAERHGYTVVSVSTISGRQIAPIVELTTTDPAAAVQDMQSLSNDLFGVPSKYEADYLTVSDMSGVPVYTVAGSFRTGIGYTQIRSNLDTRSGVAPPPE
jgi:hypothetical protein